LKDGQPQPVQIKTGITDGIFTEVTEGLTESDEIITTATSRQAGPASAAAPANPFGGGMRRF
jgi:HlyD family secretion protein